MISIASWNVIEKFIKLILTENIDITNTRFIFSVSTFIHTFQSNKSCYYLKFDVMDNHEFIYYIKHTVLQTCCYLVFYLLLNIVFV